MDVVQLYHLSEGKMLDNSLTISDLNILIVEPSTVQSKIIRGHFQVAQVSNIDIAHDGAQALDCLLGNPPDLIVSALYLPDMTGTELVQTMRKNIAKFNSDPNGHQ